jgi:hypothetical protein
MVSLLLSLEEKLLVETIEDIGYGHLYDVRIADSEKSFAKKLRDGNANFIEYLRESGYAEVEKIDVHDKEVKYVEVHGEKNGIKFTKKIRF